MTKFRKTVLSLAVMAAAGGAVNSVQAVNLAADGLGDVLLFPYYTTRNEWQTLIHLVNTSSTHSVAAKVRFQEAQNTRDVLDFNVVLSPNDVWTAWIEDDISGTPRLYSSDSTCTSPILTGAGFAFSSIAYGGGSLERAKEGHITVIEMGASNAGSINAAAKAKNCTTVDNGFSPFPTALNAPVNTTSNEFGEPLNVLKGSFAMIRLEKGLSVGGSPTTLANFFTPCTASGTTQVCNPAVPNPAALAAAAAGQNVDGAAPLGTGGVAANFGVNNLIVAQQYPDFLLPTLNDANPPVSMIEDDTTGGRQTPRTDIWTNPVDAVSAVLMRSNVMNEWSSNEVNGAETYWVVSFPTKLHYVDANAQPTAAEITGMLVPTLNANAAFIGTVATPPAVTLPVPPFSKIWTDTTFSCDTVSFNLWDRSEGGTTTGGTSISPAPPTPATSLCYEVNVLAFNPSGTDPVFNSNVAKAISTSNLVSQEPYGWMNMALPTAAPAGTPPVGGNRLTGTLATPLGAANTYAGLPVIGYTIWSRSFSPTDKTKNYGHLVDHSFKRAVTPP